MNDRTPVLVGVSQRLQRVDDPASARPPLDLMIDAVRGAAEDAEAPGLIKRVDSIRVVRGIWGYSNPAYLVAEELGIPRPETALSELGGNHVQMMINQSSLDIQEGRREVIVLTGAECGRTLGKAHRSGLEVDWLHPKPDDPAPAVDVTYGTSRWTRHQAESDRGLERPVDYYAMFEVALRSSAGESKEQHLGRISALWQSFNEVAQDNPNAWIRRPVSAEQIRAVSPSNRWICFPYPKLMTANVRVDMGAALILCSLAAARRLGVPESRWVFPLAGTDANDHYFVSERQDLHRSPAIRIAGTRALELAVVEVGDLDHIDLYSCFPSAVQIAARELGVSLEQAPTVTGGLTFGGGPLNNYVMHSVARVVELLRAPAGGRALITANGGLLTKHSFGVYGVEPPSAGFRHQDLQPEIDRQPKCELAADFEGEATIEAYSVAFGPSGQPTRSYVSMYDGSAPTGDRPSAGYIAARLACGARAWARMDEPEMLAELIADEQCGRSIRIDGAGVATFAR